jgi:peptidoglycan hydrolase CwlO-like protein
LIVAQHFINEIADVELEAEERIDELNQSHKKEIDKMRSVIKTLENGLLQTRNKFDEAKFNFTQEIHRKEQEGKATQKNYARAQKTIEQLRNQLETRNEELLLKSKEIARLGLQNEVEMNLARHQIAKLEDRIDNLREDAVLKSSNIASRIDRIIVKSKE